MTASRPTSASPLLAEELLLLALTVPKRLRPVSWRLDAGLAAALLLDLLEAGTLAAADGRWTALDAPPPEDALLARALEVVRGERAGEGKHWVRVLTRRLAPIERHVAGALARDGLMEVRTLDLRLLRLRRTKVIAPDAALRLRERVEAVLLRDGSVDRRTALLISLMRPLGLVKAAVGSGRTAAAERRADQIARGGVLGDTLAATVRELNAAIAVGGGAAAAAAAG